MADTDGSRNDGGRSVPAVILISSQSLEDFQELVAASSARGFLHKSAPSVRAIQELLGPGHHCDHRAERGESARQQTGRPRPRNASRLPRSPFCWARMVLFRRLYARAVAAEAVASGLCGEAC
ncbi:hypothetical protein GCM10011579_042310 [Streptomyces albiflavescens]|uniref:Uncharacterized protein n=1 Tax=Streptomyces albiflavescens TaxID=1623582 RepID=A0A917Y620_9ACTN|nr:hypothetical protein GCM10011579_042310 [Streptomyces albiflavescens]